MSEHTLRCPECGSAEVASASEALIMVNTGEHYSHSVKAHDDDARAVCLDCEWEGQRQDLRGEVKL